MSKHPVILELEASSYTAPPGHPDTKYLAAANKLVEQGDIAYLEGKHRTAYICYFGLVNLYQKQKSALSSIRAHVLTSMDRLEELVPKIVQEADKVGGVSSQNNQNLSPEEAALAARMAKLTGGGAAATSAPAGSMSDKYNDVQSQPQLAHTTIGMGAGGLAGLSNRIFTAGNEFETDKRSFIKNESAYGMGTDNSATYRQQKAIYANSAEATAAGGDEKTSLRESVGAIFPGQALDARQSAGYMDSITKPVEKAKYNPSLKRLHLPTSLIKVFLQEAGADLAQNIETCGIIYGHLYHGEYSIKGLVFPEQDGSPDKCSTRNEERLIDVIATRGYVVLGWIHTHPSWEPFLSSIDLHCQASYQQAIPEAVAIVCSNKNGQNAIFTLSQQGLSTIRSCSVSVAQFHQHDQSVPLFDNANHTVLHYPPGHERHHEVSTALVPPPNSGVGDRLAKWMFNEGLKRFETEVIDLRRGRSDERWYVWPERPKWITGHTPSGGQGIRRNKPQPYNPYGDNQQQQGGHQHGGNCNHSYPNLQPNTNQQPQQPHNQGYPPQQGYQPHQQQPQQQSYSPQQPQQQQGYPSQQTAYPTNQQQSQYSNLYPPGGSQQPQQPYQQPYQQQQFSPQQPHNQPPPSQYTNLYPQGQQQYQQQPYNQPQPGQGYQPRY